MREGGERKRERERKGRGTEEGNYEIHLLANIVDEEVEEVREMRENWMQIHVERGRGWEREQQKEQETLE